MAKTTAPIHVKVGQVWADNDPHCAVGGWRVESVGGTHAMCVDSRGKRTKIALRRFVPNSSGYRLLLDVEDVPSQ